MKAGWQVKALGEVVRLEYGKPLPDDQRNANGRFSVYGANGEKSRSDTFLAKGPSLIIGRKGSAGEINLANEDFWPLDVTYFTQHDPKQIELGFLHFALSMLDLPSMARGVKPGINRNDIYELTIPLPPLAEQKQIVAVLDAAFAGLSRARANVLANLDSAQELFELTMKDLCQKKQVGWKTMSVSETTVKVKVPNKIQRKAYLDQGLFPIVSQEAEKINGYWNDESDVVRVVRPIVVFGDHTRALKLIDFDFVVGADGTQLMAPISAIDPHFYFYALRTIDLKGKGYARHYSHLKKCEISFPTELNEQVQIAENLVQLEDSTAELQSHYRAKLADLDALRAALLQKAFAGELT